VRKWFKLGLIRGQFDVEFGPVVGGQRRGLLGLSLEMYLSGFFFDKKYFRIFFIFFLIFFGLYRSAAENTQRYFWSNIKVSTEIFSKYYCPSFQEQKGPLMFLIKLRLADLLIEVTLVSLFS